MKNPPAFYIFEPSKTIKLKLPNAITVNLRNCTSLLPNSLDDHKRLFDLFKQWDWKFHTQNPETQSSKRFVLHGLNSHPLEDIYEDLDKYGLLPTLVSTIPIKNPRYDDQAVYVIHYDKSSDITMDIIKQAKYIRNTVATWAPYKQNGDGVTVCSRCATPGHVGLWCNKPPNHQ